MKPLRYIPAEVWVDVFCYPWIKRKKLGKIVHRFRNRYFTEILQYCLHDRGKRTLKTVYMDEDLLHVPRTPMPDNVKFFKRIAIWHFDSRTIGFLQQINTLFLTNDVNLHLMTFGRDDLPNLRIRTVLDHLCPLIHGIRSLSFNQSAIPLMEEYFGPKLAQIKLLSLDLQSYLTPTSQTAINFALNWLTSGERNRTEPKFLEICICSRFIWQFCMAVQEQFDSAQSGCTFAIKLYYSDSYRNNNSAAGFNRVNKLGEVLYGQYDERGNFRIYRHPSKDFARTQLQMCFEEAIGKQHKSNAIGFSDQLTIGPMDANVDANELDVVAE